MKLPSFLLFLHLAGVVLWVGGMFFAYVCLRPTAVKLFEPPQRSAWFSDHCHRHAWTNIGVTIFHTLPS